eukprot:11170145-Lingulodinium_polyedra.AAC.1
MRAPSAALIVLATELSRRRGFGRPTGPLCLRSRLTSKGPTSWGAVEARLPAGERRASLYHVLSACHNENHGDG